MIQDVGARPAPLYEADDPPWKTLLWQLRLVKRTQSSQRHGAIARHRMLYCTASKFHRRSDILESPEEIQAQTLDTRDQECISEDCTFQVKKNDNFYYVLWKTPKTSFRRFSNFALQRLPRKKCCVFEVVHLSSESVKPFKLLLSITSAKYNLFSPATSLHIINSLHHLRIAYLYFSSIVFDTLKAFGIFFKSVQKPNKHFLGVLVPLEFFELPTASATFSPADLADESQKSQGHAVRHSFLRQCATTYLPHFGCCS